MSLYDDLGGQVALESAVFLFYEKLLADDSVNYYFDNVDVEVQQKKMVAFMKQAFGDEYEHTSADLRTAHAHLGVTEAQFDIVVGHLQAVLKELGIAEELQVEILSIISATKADVLNQ